MTIDLNADVGEGFPWDDELMEIVTSGNICLGLHAGSRELTEITAARWKGAGKAIGMHPGYPDREGMGRRSAETEREEKDWSIATFLQAAWARGKVEGWTYLKPHGAFYNDSAKPGDAAGDSLVRALREARLPLLGMPGTMHAQLADSVPTAFFREGFADRRYREDGTLVPRTESGVTIESDAEAAEQAVRLALSGRFESICLHGDKPGCVDRALAVRTALEREGFVLAPFRP